MRFENLKNRYWTNRNYLEKRCEALPNQLERKFKNCEASHTASTCYGMSNYIDIEKQDENGDYLDSITIRISDHNPTGSGEHCDHYLYIEGRTWMEIKNEVMNIAEEFLN